MDEIVNTVVTRAEPHKQVFSSVLISWGLWTKYLPVLIKYIVVLTLKANIFGRPSFILPKTGYSQSVRMLDYRGSQTATSSLGLPRRGLLSNRLVHFNMLEWQRLIALILFCFAFQIHTGWKCCCYSSCYCIRIRIWFGMPRIIWWRALDDPSFQVSKLSCAVFTNRKWFWLRTFQANTIWYFCLTAEAHHSIGFFQRNRAAPFMVPTSRQTSLPGRMRLGYSLFVLRGYGWTKIFSLLISFSIND